MADENQLEPRLRKTLSQWVTTLRSKTTQTTYQEAVSRFLDTVKGDLSPDAILSYRASLSPLAPATVARHVSAVRSFLSFAMDLKVIPQCPIELLTRPTVEVTTLNKFLTDDEALRVLDTARTWSPHAYAAIVLLAATGMRVSELARAQWRQLTRNRDGILGLWIVGKGGKGRQARLPEELWPILTTLHGSTELSATDKRPLLPNERGNFSSRDDLYKLVKRIAKKAGVVKAVSPHWFRHTYGTAIAQQGESPYAIQQAMGHTRIETSARYVHLTRGLSEFPTPSFIKQ